MQEQVVHALMRAMPMLVEELSAAFGLVPPFDAYDVRDAVQLWRGCRIDLEPYDMGAEPVYGLCVYKRPAYYVIFYRADATVIQQQRIIFHELCHIILSHVGPLNPMHVLHELRAAPLQEPEAESFAEAMTRYALTMTSTRTCVAMENELVDSLTRFVEAMGGRA